MDDQEARERVARVEELLEELEDLADPSARAAALEAIRALLDLYGEGLGRIVATAAAHDADGALAEALAEDELVSHLLLLHDLHPVPVEARVRGALEDVRPYLESHRGDVELLEVADGVVRLRLEGSCSGCPSSTATLKLAIEDAIRKAAPEVEVVEALGATPAPARSPLLQIEVPGGPVGENGSGGDPWAVAGVARELRRPQASPHTRSVGGEELVFLSARESLYAYRPACPACGAALAEASLAGTELTCGGCGIRYDVVHAGACLDRDELHLEPVPLLVDEDGMVKVAAASPAGA